MKRRIPIGKGLLWEMEHPRYINIPNLTLDKMEELLNKIFSIEHNNNTSAGHPAKDDDIVRYSFEKRRVKDKEP